MKKVAILLSILLSFSCLCSCGGESVGSGNGDGKSNLEQITSTEKEEKSPVLLIGATRVELIVGESFVLNYILKDSQETVLFKSLNESIVSVDSTGKITANKVGEAYIAVQAGECYETCLVRVNAEPTYRVVCADNSILLVVGNEFVIEAALKKGKEIIDAELMYESMDETVAQVENGTIKGIGYGDTQIKISCVYENEYYEKIISVSVGNSVYIDAPNSLSLEYMATNTLEYSIRTFDDVIVPDAIAEITCKDSNMLSIVGNAITAMDCGTTTLILTHGKVSVEIPVEINLGVEETEYNLFKHTSALADIEVRHFNSGTQCVSPSIVNEVLGQTGTFLCVSSRYVKPASAARPSCKYLGLYLPSRLSKEEIQTLKDNGYTKMKVEYCVQSEMSDAIYVQVLKKATQGQQNNNVTATNFGRWFTFTVPIDDILANYDALANKTQMFMGAAVENEVDEFKLYVKPLSFVK